jgi:tRNA modification GTPase
MDTIVALATPPGVSALAVLRLSGPDVLALIRPLLVRSPEWRPQQAVHLTLRKGAERLDDVVATYWQKPRSYTGEDILEISCHGNPLIAQKIMEALLLEGARVALPGEFTQRAFLNGKLDLTQAEAVMDVLSAATDEALQGAQAMQTGKLGASLHEARESLIAILAHLEAYIDFPDEDISPETGDLFFQRVDHLRRHLQQLLKTAPLGRILREGVRTVIVGEPNVGKSSLLNALLRENRAIVSAQPGTTRDTIEAECNLEGFRLRLLDTAGQRSTTDQVEEEGVRRAQEALSQAELILHVVEAPQPLPSTMATFQPHPGQRYIRVANKVDLGLHPDHQAQVAVTTQGPDGIRPLEEKILQVLQEEGRGSDCGWLTINARQEAALRKAEAALAKAEESMREKFPPELVSLDLRIALQAVGEVVGVVTEEDILDQIFKNFCIGK